MPKNTPNPGDEAADAARKADEQKTSDEQKAKLHDEAEKNLAAQREAEDERRGQSADAASPRGQAIERMVAGSHMSEADAGAAYDASMASRDEGTFLHAQRAVTVPDATYGATGDVTPVGMVPTPAYSPQNRAPDNTPADGSRDAVVMSRSGPLPMPPYSPQNRPYDNDRPPQHAGGPQPPQFRDTSIAAGLTRPLMTVLQEGEASVPMLFDRSVTLTLDDHSRVQFPAGLNQVPEHLAEHWYLLRSGAKRVEGGEKK